MLTAAQVRGIAAELLEADATAASIEPISQRVSDFDMAAAYQVLDEISEQRRAQGWTAVGRKIGFTNTTIWDLYGVDGPMWADIWDRTVRSSAEADTVCLSPFVEPRIEPEIVFKLAAPVPITDDPVRILESIEWMAAGFEIVRSPFPGWRFGLADCTAAFGLHGALVVGPPVGIDGFQPGQLATMLSTFEVTLSRDGLPIDVGIGSNVLSSPALALSHLAKAINARANARPLAAGEIITTGTLTDAWPVAPREVWSAHFGCLSVEPLTVAFT